MRIGPGTNRPNGTLSEGEIKHDLIRPHRLGMLIPHSHEPEFFEVIEVPSGARRLEMTLKGMTIRWRFK